MDIREALSTYTPRGVEIHNWHTVRDFVVEVLVDFYRKDSDSLTRRKLVHVTGIVTRIAVQAHCIQSYPLTREMVFDHRMIESFVAGESVTKRVKGAHRSYLVAIGQKLNPEWEGDTGAPRYGNRPASCPYTVDEVKSLMFWAKGRPTDYAKISVQVVIALGLGAGLRPGEIATLKVSDVLVTDDGVFVYPQGYRGAPPREVVVMEEFEGLIASVVENLPPDSFVAFPLRTSDSVELITKYCLRYGLPIDVQFSLPRLRATWVVMQMFALIPETVICKAAGMADLQHYKRYRPVLDDSTFAHVFRGTHFVGVIKYADDDDQDQDPDQDSHTALDDELLLLNHDPDLDKD